MIKRKTLVLVLSIVLATSLRSQTISDTLIKKVDSLFAQWNVLSSPGCAIGIVKNDSLLYAKGFGMANLEYDIPINPSTVFNMGSVSKQFTAYCIVLLASQGKIKLDEDIHVYLPELSNFGKRITVRNLLNHTSGIREYLSLAAITGIKKNDGTFTNDLAINLLKKQRSLNFIPGSMYSYSNSNFLLLADIVETVSGRSLRAFADSAIFKPLGMSHTFFLDDYTELIRNRAYSYNSTESNHFTNNIRNEYTVGGSGLVTNIQDMAKWVSNYYHPKIGDIKDIEQLTEKGKLNNGKQLNYALGIVVNKYKGWRIFEHGGDYAAYHSYLLVFPDAKMGFLVFGNAGNFNAFGAAHDLASLFILDTTTSRVAVSAKKIDSNLTIIKDTATIRKLVGSYLSDKGEQFTFWLKDNKLYADVEGDSYLLMKSNTDTFSMIDHPDVKICFSKNFDKSKSCIIVDPNGDTEEGIDTLKQYNLNTMYQDRLLQYYTGEYYSSELDFKYKITLKAHQLLLSNKRFNDAKLTLAGDNAIITDVWWMPYLKILRNSNNSIQGFEINGPRLRHLRFMKVK